MRARDAIANASAGSIRTWWHFAIGAAMFVLIAGGLELAAGRMRTSLSAQTLTSLLFGLQLLVLAGIGAIALWLVMRAAKGKDAAPEFRDSVLWSTCLIGGLVMFVRMLY